VLAGASTVSGGRRASVSSKGNGAPCWIPHILSLNDNKRSVLGHLFCNDCIMSSKG